MTQVDLTLRDDVTVKDRLIKAAEAEIAAHGIGAVKMEAVAKRAGVSRATAFRQLGTMYELLVQVALSHSRQHTAAMQSVMDGCAGAFAKIEAALVYTTRELPNDPMVSAVMAQPSTSVHPRVHGAATEVLAPVLVEGQRNGDIRMDVGIDELVRFVVEQSYLAAGSDDRSEREVRRRFRHFIEPGLAKSPHAIDTSPCQSADVQIAVQAAVEAVNHLALTLRQDRG